MISKKIVRFLVLFSLISSISVFLDLSLVSGHSPSTMSLSYDFETEELSVSISHSVMDNETHYVNSLVITKDNVEVVSETYTSQPSTSGFVYKFTINATDGEEFSATANCNQGGSITRTLTVNDPSDTGTNTDEGNENGDSSISGFSLTFGFIAIFLAIFGIQNVIKRKKV